MDRLALRYKVTVFIIKRSKRYVTINSSSSTYNLMYHFCCWWCTFGLVTNIVFCFCFFVVVFCVLEICVRFEFSLFCSFHSQYTVLFWNTLCCCCCCFFEKCPWAIPIINLDLYALSVSSHSISAYLKVVKEKCEKRTTIQYRMGNNNYSIADSSLFFPTMKRKEAAATTAAATAEPMLKKIRANV